MTITEKKAKQLMKSVDKLYDADVIDQYAYEKAMNKIRSMEEEYLL